MALYHSRLFAVFGRFVGEDESGRLFRFFFFYSNINILEEKHQGGVLNFI